MPLIDVLVVGVGRWGFRHLSTLKEMQNLGEIGELRAYDIDLSKREIVEQIGAIWSPQYRHHDSVAIIATSSSSHFDIALELINEGMHVLIEKPMAQTVEDARALMAAALSKGVHIETGLLLRHHPAVKQTRRLIAQGEIGDIERIHCIRHSSRSNIDGESIIDILATHYLDLCCHLLHEAEPTSITSDILEEGNKVKCSISMEFEPGIEALCDVSWGSENEIKQVQIFGTTDNISIELDNYEELFQGDQKISLKNTISPLKAELQSFIRRIEAGVDISTIPQRPALRSVSWKDMLSFSSSGVMGLQQH